jgi:hypothetical protein
MRGNLPKLCFRMQLTSKAQALRRPRILMLVVAFVLFMSGVTIWPWEIELELLLSVLDATGGPQALADTVQSILTDMRRLRDENSAIPYLGDWLAYAHIVLCVLFLMALKDPVRNILVVRLSWTRPNSSRADADAVAKSSQSAPPLAGYLMSVFFGDTYVSSHSACFPLGMHLLSESRAPAG